MYERFTDRARFVTAMAWDEAVRRRHGQIDTEHLLIALTYDDRCAAAIMLSHLGVPLVTLRQYASDVIGPDGTELHDHPVFTARVKNVFELSLREALRTGTAFIGTEHLLLGLIRESDGVTSQLLRAFGIDIERVRAQLGSAMGGSALQDAMRHDPARRRAARTAV